MRKSLKRGSLALGAILALNACGGSSATTETAEAYYLDSAVAGVNYKCGSLEGITDEEGKFSFEKGQACVFSLGEIFLRAMDSTLLVEGKKIVEENLTVATVLQSLDNDGDPSNGITITKEVINAFESAVKEVSDALVIPQTVEHLETVVATIENNVTDFNGHIVSQEDALAHLQETQIAVATEVQTEATEETKALLAGKTFYVVISGISTYDDEPYTNFLGMTSYNEDMTVATKREYNEDTGGYDEDEYTLSYTIHVEGKSIEDKWGSLTLIAQNKTYLTFKGVNTEYGETGEYEWRAYFNEADAKAFAKAEGDPDLQ
jgi:hypothetical protein